MVCGIFLDQNSNLDRQTIENIIRKLTHRGPDQTCIYVDNELNLTSVFARLAIRDITEKASQPFFSDDKRFYLLFNGEIYNSNILRMRLLGNFELRTNSDTEILLRHILDYGLKPTLNLIEGMFSIILVDKRTGIIQVARDMFGIKPLYYLKKNDGSFAFASEVKVLQKVESSFINKNILREFLICGLIDHTNQTFFSNIQKVGPGEIITLKESNFTIERWVEVNKDNLDFLTQESLIEYLDSFLDTSFRNAVISDRPIGITISSGLDSNIIREFVEREDIKTEFHSVSWGEKTYSESLNALKYIKNIDNFFIHNFTASETFFQIQHSFEIFDEPFTSPFVAIWPRVYRSIKENNISVILDGTGADEIFLGYSKYLNSDFSSYMQSSLDGVNNSIGFKSYFLHEPTDLQVANLMDTFQIKLPRSLRFLDYASMSQAVEVRPIYLTKQTFFISQSIQTNWQLYKNHTKHSLRLLMRQRSPNFPAFDTKQNIQLPIFEWMNIEWRDEISKNLANIDSLLDFIESSDEKKVIASNIHNFIQGKVFQHSYVIWRAFITNLWLSKM